MLIFHKKVFVFVAVTLVIMIVTNPSYTAFEERTQSLEITPEGVYPKTYQVKRERMINGFIYSTYLVEAGGTQTDYGQPYRKSKKYLGILGNFFEIK